jgi:hypothetical protein
MTAGCSCPTVCEAADHTGRSIDEINIGACLLDESTARLDALKGITQPEAAVLKSTGNTDPDALSWYTTREGSRIAMPALAYSFAIRRLFPGGSNGRMMFALLG